jgi:hypothetical protein
LRVNGAMIIRLAKVISPNEIGENRLFLSLVTDVMEPSNLNDGIQRPI